MASGPLVLLLLFGVGFVVGESLAENESATTRNACGKFFDYHFNGRCYYIGWVATTASEARLICKAMGADLVAIESYQEDNYLSLQLKGLNINGACYWTSGHQVLPNSNHHWIWKSTGKTIATYARWAPNEPTHTSSEYCLCMCEPFNFGWFDTLCGSKKSFVCEKSANTGR